MYSVTKNSLFYLGITIFCRQDIQVQLKKITMKYLKPVFGFGTTMLTKKNRMSNPIKSCNGDGDFEKKVNEAEDNKLVVVYFTRNSDKENRSMSSYVQKQADINPNALFLKANMDVCKATASEYDIQIAPSFMFRKNKEYVLQFEDEDRPMLKDFIAHYQSTSSRDAPMDTVIYVANDNDFKSKTRAARDRLIVMVFVRKSSRQCGWFLPVVQKVSETKPHVLFFVVDKDACQLTATTYGITYKVRLPAFNYQVDYKQRAEFDGPNIRLFMDNVVEHENVNGIPRTRFRRLYSDVDFESELNKSNERLVVVYFTKRLDEGCHRMYPDIETLAKTKQNVVFLNVDVDFCNKTAISYAIKYVPVFVLRKLQNEIARFAGHDIEQLRTHIRNNRPPPTRKVKIINDDSELDMELANAAAAGRTVLIEVVKFSDLRDSFTHPPLDDVIETYTAITFLNVNMEVCTEFAKRARLDVTLAPLFVLVKNKVVTTVWYVLDQFTMETNIQRLGS